MVWVDDAFVGSGSTLYDHNRVEVAKVSRRSSLFNPPGFLVSISRSQSSTFLDSSHTLQSAKETAQEILSLELADRAVSRPSFKRDILEHKLATFKATSNLADVINVGRIATYIRALDGNREEDLSPLAAGLRFAISLHENIDIGSLYLKFVLDRPGIQGFNPDDMAVEIVKALSKYQPIILETRKSIARNILESHSGVVESPSKKAVDAKSIQSTIALNHQSTRKEMAAILAVQIKSQSGHDISIKEMDRVLYSLQVPLNNPNLSTFGERDSLKVAKSVESFIDRRESRNHTKSKDSVKYNRFTGREISR